MKVMFMADKMKGDRWQDITDLYNYMISFAYS